MDRSGHRLAAICAALVVLAAVPTAGAGGAAASAPAATVDTRPADVIYVADDGDAVLAYRDSVPDATTTARTGLTVGQRLLGLLLVDEAGVPSDVAGVDATLSPGEVAGAEALSGAAPEDLRSLSFRSAARQTDRRSSGQLSLTAAVATPDADPGTVTTSGRAEIGPESYVYAGRVVVAGADVDEDDAAVALTETDAGYRLRVERTRTVAPDDPDWGSRADAADTLAARYGAVAARFDGERSVTVERYERTAAGDAVRVDLAYTVRFRGVEPALSERLARELAADRDLELSDAEARSVGERVAATEVERVAATVTAGDGRVAVDWTVRLGGYAALPDAVLAIAASQDDLGDGARSALASYRERLDARRAADLSRTVDWNGTLSVADGTTSVSLTVESGADGWAAYVEELAERGRAPPSFAYDVAARTVDGRVVAEANVTLQGDDLVDRLRGAGLAGLDNAGRAGTLVDALRQAGFDRARMDVTVDGDRVSASGGARIRNLSALAPLLEVGVAGQFRDVAARAATDERVSYVRVPGLVGPDATRADVRALSVADDDTVIRMPGEWDREFPRMPIRSPAAVLEERTRPAPTAGTAASDEDPSSGGGLPGFGVGLALAGLAALAALALWRRR